MRIQEAIKRLSFTISKQNKPNNTDADALNSIIDFINISNKQVIQENLLLAKMYAFVLKEFINHYEEVNFASRQINADILNKPLNYHLEYLTMGLQSTEINKFFKSLDLKPTWVNGQTIDEINTNIEINKESLNKIDGLQFKQVSETWNEQNVISNFEFNFNLALNTYKNV
jgi:hypothetical protein